MNELETRLVNMARVETDDIFISACLKAYILGFNVFLDEMLKTKGY